MTSAHIINFKKAVTYASSVWGGNIAKNMDYIATYMNSYGGNPGDEFCVFIQTFAYNNDWNVYSYGNVIATFAAGLNPN